MKKHIVLVGLPGAGKSTVGKIVAERLQTGYVDIDSILIRKEGKPIALIFAEKGEPAFRDMERQEVETALGHEPAVIVPGGGWAAQPGQFDAARSHGYFVYLKARAEVAARSCALAEGRAREAEAQAAAAREPRSRGTGSAGAPGSASGAAGGPASLGRRHADRRAPAPRVN